jgi:hypothetical protein
MYDKKEQSHFHRPATVRAFCLRVETSAHVKDYQMPAHEQGLADHISV